MRHYSDVRCAPQMCAGRATMVMFVSRTSTGACAVIIDQSPPGHSLAPCAHSTTPRLNVEIQTVRLRQHSVIGSRCWCWRVLLAWPCQLGKRRSAAAHAKRITWRATRRTSGVRCELVVCVAGGVVGGWWNVCEKPERKPAGGVGPRSSGAPSSQSHDTATDGRVGEASAAVELLCLACYAADALAVPPIVSFH
jgi:hypothetical protein